MTWGIVFIIVAVVMAVGPIMMFKPSNHTRRLEELRTEAATLGLKLRTVNYESRNQQLSVVVYSYPCQTAFDAAAILKRHDIAHDIHFYQQWDWQEGKTPELSSSQSQSLVDFVEKLPETVIGLEFSADSVGLWWQEKGLEKWGMKELEASLMNLKGLLS